MKDAGNNITFKDIYSYPPYHWDDRKKLWRDFGYLQNLNKDIISALSPILNSIHEEDRTRQYWHLLLGYWVNVFTAVMYDRWFVVKNAMDKELIDVDSICSESIVSLAANDTEHFEELVSTDKWNEGAIALIVNQCFSPEPRELVPSNSSSHHKKAFSSGVDRVKSRLKDKVKRILFSVSAKLGKEDPVVFSSSYMKFRPRQKLLRRFGIGPRYWMIPKLPEFEYKYEMRSWKLSLPTGRSCFTDLIIESLPRMIPKAFIEGYQRVANAARNMGWPDSPKVIWTSNSHFADEVFKAWAGAKRELGSRLVIGEHGGFGTGKFNGAGTYQLQVADCFISTGWGRNNNKIAPTGNFRELGKKQKWDPQGGALLVCVVMPKYSFDMRSMVVAGQMISYFEDQFSFVDSLPSAIKQKMLVRLFSPDRGWKQKDRWHHRHPDIMLEERVRPIGKLIKKSRVFISTYNATTYYEPMFHNIPTIIYWNPEHWEVNDDAQPFFEELKRAGIFHDSPHSAAEHLSSIWDNIEEWWHCDDVQEAKNSFCDKYNANPPDLLDRLEKVLRGEMEIAAQNMTAISAAT